MSPGEPREGDGAGRPLGRIVVGALLVAAGTIWLLEAGGVVDFPLRAILPIALVGVGFALVVGSRRGAQAGLIVLGAVLVTLLTLGSVVLPRADLRGEEVGDQVERPTTTRDLRPYRLAAGELRVDLTGLRVPRRGTDVEARVGVGKLVVTVPVDASLRVEANAGIGRVEVFGAEAAGLGVDREIVRGGSRGRISLELSVGMGEVVVLPEAVSAPFRDRVDPIPPPRRWSR